MATNAGDYWLRAGIALPPLSQPPSEEEIANLLAKYPIPATPFHWELVDRPPAGTLLLTFSNGQAPPPDGLRYLPSTPAERLSHSILQLPHPNKPSTTIQITLECLSSYLGHFPPFVPTAPLPPDSPELLLTRYRKRWRISNGGGHPGLSLVYWGQDDRGGVHGGAEALKALDGWERSPVRSYPLPNQARSEPVFVFEGGLTAPPPPPPPQHIPQQSNGQIPPSQMTPMQQQLFLQQQANRIPPGRSAPTPDYTAQSPSFPRPGSSLSNGHAPNPNYPTPSQIQLQQNLAAQQASQSATLASTHRQRYEDLLRSQQSSNSVPPTPQQLYENQLAQQAMQQTNSQHVAQLQAYHQTQLQPRNSAYPPQQPLGAAYQNRPPLPSSAHSRNPSETQSYPSQPQPLSVAQQRSQQESIQLLQDQQTQAIFRQNRERQARSMQEQQQGGNGGPRTAADVAQQYEIQRQRANIYQQQQQQALQQQQQRLDPRRQSPTFSTAHLPPPPSAPGLMDPLYRGDVFDRITKRSLAINRFANNHDQLSAIFDRWSVEDILDGSKRRREEGAIVEGKRKRKFVVGGFLGEGMREEREFAMEEREATRSASEKKVKVVELTKKEESDERKLENGKDDVENAATTAVPISKPNSHVEASTIEEEPIIKKRREYLLAMREELLKETAELERKHAETVMRISGGRE